MFCCKRLLGFFVCSFAIGSSFCSLCNFNYQNFDFGLFVCKCFRKSTVLFCKRDILCGKFDVFLLFCGVKRFQSFDFFLQSLEFILQLSIFIFKILDFFFKLVHLILQIIDRGSMFKNSFLQKICFLEPFCFFFGQNSDLFLFGSQCDFDIFIVFFRRRKFCRHSCTIFFSSRDCVFLLCEFFFKLSNLFVERFCLCIPDFGSLFLGCDDFFGCGNDQIHRFQLNLESIVFGGKCFVISNLGGKRFLGVRVRAFQCGHTGRQFVSFFLQGLCALLFLQKRNLCFCKRFLSQIVVSKSCQAFCKAFFLCKERFCFLSFFCQKNFHLVQFRKNVSVFTDNFIIKLSALVRFFLAVLDFFQILCSFCFPFIGQAFHILRHLGDIVVNLCFIVSSECASETVIFLICHNDNPPYKS